MDIIISNVKFNAPFMFKDPADLREALNEKLEQVILKSSKFEKKYGEAKLAFIVVLNRKTTDLEIKGPTVDSELVDYALWLPYKKIENSKNYRITYINYIKEGILKVLAKFDFDLKIIENIFSDIINEKC